MQDPNIDGVFDLIDFMEHFASVAERSYPRPEVRGPAERSYPAPEVRDGGCAFLEQP